MVFSLFFFKRNGCCSGRFLFLIVLELFYFSFIFFILFFQIVYLFLIFSIVIANGILVTIAIILIWTCRNRRPWRRQSINQVTIISHYIIHIGLIPPITFIIADLE